MSKLYRADYADEGFELIEFCDSDCEALKEAFSYEAKHGTLFNLFEVDENYDEVRTVF